MEIPKLEMLLAEKVKQKFKHTYKVTDDEVDEVFLILVEKREKLVELMANNMEREYITVLWNILRKRLLIQSSYKDTMGQIRRCYINKRKGNVSFDELEELVDEEETVNKKFKFYEHIDDFALSRVEQEFIELIFSGYHPTYDAKIFEELNLKCTASLFFNRLLLKLKENSPFLERK
jgi:hypothetical protein